MAEIRTLSNSDSSIQYLPNTVAKAVYIEEVGSDKETVADRLSTIRTTLQTINTSKIDTVKLESPYLVFEASGVEIAKIEVMGLSITGLVIGEDGKLYLADFNGNAFGTGVRVESTGNSGEGSGSTEVHITSLTLDSDSQTVSVGNNFELTAIINSDATNTNVEWLSNNSNITLTPSGLSCTVTGVTAGNSIITCTSANNSDIKDTCAVVIEDISGEMLNEISLRILPDWVGAVTEDSNDTEYVLLNSPYNSDFTGKIVCYNNITVYNGIGLSETDSTGYVEGFATVDIYDPENNVIESTIKAINCHRDVFRSTKGEWFTWSNGSRQTLKIAKSRIMNDGSTPSLNDTKSWLSKNPILLNIKSIVDNYRSSFKKAIVDETIEECQYMYSNGAVDVYKIKHSCGGAFNTSTLVGSYNMYSSDTLVMAGIGGYDVDAGYVKMGIHSSECPNRTYEEVVEYLRKYPVTIYYIEQ